MKPAAWVLMRWKASHAREAVRNLILGADKNKPSLKISLSRAIDSRSQGVATRGDEPEWLLINYNRGTAGHWIRLQYKASLLGPLVRPLLRIDTSNGSVLKTLPAPLFGRATWVGYIPATATKLWLSPDKGKATTAFEIESLRILPLATLIALALVSGDVLRVWFAMALWFIGQRTRASDELEAAMGITGLTHYHEWRSRNIREPDWESFDVSQFTTDCATHVCFVIDSSDQSCDDDLEKTLASLHDQELSNWTAVILSSARGTKVQKKIVRTIFMDRTKTIRNILAMLPDRAMLAPMRAGDVLPSYAMATLCEFLKQNPEHEVVYADDEGRKKNGRFVEPRLKPDWSPIFQKAHPYLQGAVYFLSSVLEQHAGRLAVEMLTEDGVNQLVSESAKVGHLRRVMLTRPHNGDPAPTKTGLRELLPRFCAQSANGIYATIIIPSKDKAVMLMDCVRSLQSVEPSNLEIIIVDNGSVEDATLDAYMRLRTDARVRVINAPGKFNFSALCNTGAELAAGPVLVFLNNDTSALRPDWLWRLVSWAREPNVGAVGAKLLYPSGNVQHGGIVLGLGGIAGHTELNVLPDSRGYLDRLTCTHELSAVTGACLAVEKCKFEAAGGFDSVRFPVDLNDVDLCLRLSERGWSSILVPQSVLIHQESATRGKTLYRPNRYEFERENFRARWNEKLRDDPYFHPSLSLQSEHVALE